MDNLSLTEKSYLYIRGVINNLPVSCEWSRLKWSYVSPYKRGERIEQLKETEKSLTYCPSCFNFFNENRKIVRIQPQRKGRFARRLLKKGGDQKPLTKYQAKYLKRADKHVGNKMVIKCAACKRTIHKNLTKPTLQKCKPKEIVECKPKNKKKKKKDQFSGLNRTAVMSVERELLSCQIIFGNAKNNTIEKKKAILNQKKKQEKSKKILSKLNATVNKSNKSSNSDLSKFLNSL